MAHLFEAYAMANLMMCSAVATGTMHSRSTGMMRGSCARHLRATIGILQPTLVISEGAGLDEPLCAALGVTKPMSKTLPRCDLDGNQFVRASLRHPPRSPQDPYLREVLAPTIRKARALVL